MFSADRTREGDVKGRWMGKNRPPLPSARSPPSERANFPTAPRGRAPRVAIARCPPRSREAAPLALSLSLSLLTSSGRARLGLGEGVLCHGFQLFESSVAF